MEYEKFEAELLDLLKKYGLPADVQSAISRVEIAPAHLKVFALTGTGREISEVCVFGWYADD